MTDHQPVEKRRRNDHGEFAVSKDLGPGANSRHPLLNSVVLERVFSFCELELLRNIRIVCTTWQKMTLSKWRNEKTITIDIDNNDSDQCSTMALSKSLNLGDLHQLQEASFADRPFKSYRLRNWIFSPVPLPDPYLNKLDTFFVQCGTSMRKLTLVNPQIQNAEGFYKTICEFTPNLKSLALIELKGDNEFCNEDGGPPVNEQSNITSLKIAVDPIDDSFKLKVPWRQFFLRFPNLERLEIGSLPCFRPSNVTTLKDALRTIGEVKGQLRIKVLDMRDTLLYYADAKDILATPNLQLKELHLNIQVQYHPRTLRCLNVQGRIFEIAPGVPDLSILSFIEEHAPILHCLRLTTGHGQASALFDNFLFRVRFDSLSELKLHGNIVQSWDFLEHTPNLKILSIWNCEVKDLMKPCSYMTIENLGVALPHMEEFRLDIPLPLEAIEFFVKLMPNLRIFVLSGLFAETGRN